MTRSRIMLLVFLVPALIFGALFGQSVAQNKPAVRINGHPLQLSDQDPAPFIDGSRILVPMRAILEQLGATVDWDHDTRTVTATLNGHKVTVQIGSEVATQDGQEVILDVPARLVSDRTFLPLRFTAEALGATVLWNDQSFTADINLVSTPVAAVPHLVGEFINPVDAPSLNSVGGKSVTNFVVQAANASFISTEVSASDNPCKLLDPYTGETMCLVGWEPVLAHVVTNQQLVGIVQLTNKTNQRIGPIKYIQKTSGTHTYSVTGTVSENFSVSLKAPVLKFAEAQLSAQLVLSASGTWSWTTDETWEFPFEVQPNKTLIVARYNMGAEVSGVATFEHKYWDYDREETVTRRFQETMTAQVPSGGENYYEFIEVDNPIKAPSVPAVPGTHA